jgi:uncharacterized membrane protein YjgN (DUF898 family)
MRAPLDKMKKADRALMAAFVFCLIVGLATFAFILRTYLKHELLTDTQSTPAPVDVYDSLFVVAHMFVYWFCPCVAAGYLLVGYVIWNYRRKRGTIENHDKPDA